MKYVKIGSKFKRKYGMTSTEIVAFLGLSSTCTVSELEKAGLLEPLVNLVKNRNRLKELKGE